MQRTSVLFSLLTERPITICKPDWGSRGSEALFLPPQAIGTHVIHRHAGKLLTQIKQKFINLLSLETGDRQAKRQICFLYRFALKQWFLNCAFHHANLPSKVRLSTNPVYPAWQPPCTLPKSQDYQIKDHCRKGVNDSPTSKTTLMA